MMASTSCGRNTIRLPKTRHAPMRLAKLRRRRSDQPIRFASAAGVVVSGNTLIRQVSFGPIAGQATGEKSWFEKIRNHGPEGREKGFGFAYRFGHREFHLQFTIDRRALCLSCRFAVRFSTFAVGHGRIRGLFSPRILYDLPQPQEMPEPFPSFCPRKTESATSLGGLQSGADGAQVHLS